MKKNLLSVLVVGIIAVAAFFVTNRVKNDDVANKTVAVTKKSNKQPKAKRIKEALEWRYAKLVNPEKGYFDPQDLYAAHKRADYLKNVHAKSGSLNLQWNLIGPDNQGGRTRALMFDVNVPNKLWAGSVGGGLFVSNNGGNSWERVVSYNGNFPIASIAQGSDGAIYVGTGEGLGNPLSGGSSSFNSQSPGNGIFKSSDGGATWQHLSATNDANGINANGDHQVISGGCTWCGVNAIAVSPVNNQVVLAGSENGLYISSDGGATFTAASSPLSGGQIQAIQITNDGQIAFAVRQGALYRSVSVVDNFQSGWTIASGVGTGSRADVAIAPSNENYVYAVISRSYGGGHCMEGVYRSTDGGDNWTKIIQSGAPSYKSDPFNQPTEAYGTCSGQGWYDMTIAVNPADENKIYIGGITLYTWGEGIGFRRADKIDTEGGTPFDSDYIHADKHKIIFNPQDATGNTMLVGSDGGVTLCNNALVGFPENLNFIQKNKGYATLQVYGMGAGAYGEVLSGNQDNGSQYIDGLGSSVQAASEISGGDGVYAEISNFDPDVMFAGVYFGSINRSVNRGLSTNSFLDKNIDLASCGKISCSNTGTACNSNYTNFIYPFYLLESSNVANPTSRATLIARNDTLLLANGSTQIIRDTLYPDRKVTVTTTVSESGTTVEDTVIYKSVYEITSYISNEITFERPLASVVYPGDTLLFPDPYDAKYFVTSTCGLWMCINPLQKNQEPHFYKISGSSSSINSFDATLDGDKLYYVVGRSLYIVEGLNQVTDGLNTEEGCSNLACTSGLLTIRGPISIPSASGTAIEGVSVDKNDPNIVLVTAAGFGSTGKVFRVENALSGSPTVVALQQNDNELPYMPVYDCIIDADNSDRYIIATELGIWTSDDAGLTWNEENNGLFGRIPVYRLRQEWMYETSCYVLYAGTHGGGMFRCTTLTSGGCDTEPYKWPVDETGIVNTPLVLTNVNIYPNPVTSTTTVEFDLKNNADVNLRVFDMMGRVVYTQSYGKLNSGVQDKQLNLSNLTTGVYSVTISVDGKLQGSKQIVKK